MKSWNPILAARGSLTDELDPGSMPVDELQYDEPSMHDLRPGGSHDYASDDPTADDIAALEAALAERGTQAPLQSKYGPVDQQDPMDKWGNIIGAAGSLAPLLAGDERADEPVQRGLLSQHFMPNPQGYQAPKPRDGDTGAKLAAAAQGIGKGMQSMAAGNADRTEKGRAAELVEDRKTRHVSDAQAGQLVRTYGMDPKAAANMTLAEWDEMLPLLKSTPYVYQQGLARAQKAQRDENELDLRAKTAEDKNAAAIRIAEIRAAAKRGKGGKGGGAAGGGAPVDFALLTANQMEVPEAAVQEAIAAAQNDSVELTPDQQRILTQLHYNESLTGDRLAKALDTTSGALASSGNQRRGARTRSEYQGLGAGQVLTKKDAYDVMISRVNAAMKAVKNLKAAGKLDELAKLPYNSWVGNAAMAGHETDLQSIQGLLNPQIRQDVGAHMGPSEAGLSMSKFGLSDSTQPWKTGAAIEAYLRQYYMEVARSQSLFKKALAEQGGL